MTNQSASPQNLTFDLEAYLQSRKAIVEKALNQSLAMGEPATIYEAMRYSLLAGGKRFRPILCLASCELVGGTIEMAMPTACALEMVHTMSLIHDDLPAMDNDDYRRGQLTNHKKFGEDMAILAGDGLLSYAFEYIAAYTRDVDPNAVLKVIAKLGASVGAAGLVGGQVVDLASENNPDISLETLQYIHTHKTGALLEACVVSGALLGGAKEEELAGLSRYAYNIGLAFQIIDDILDITATQEELGKTAGKDVAADKATYPRLLGLEASKAKADELIEGAVAEISPYGDAGIPLQALAQFIANRKN